MGFKTSKKVKTKFSTAFCGLLQRNVPQSVNIRNNCCLQQKIDHFCNHGQKVRKAEFGTHTGTGSKAHYFIEPVLIR